MDEQQRQRIKKNYGNKLGYDAEGRPLSGLPLLDLLRELTGGHLLLSFSGGKDSIAMWLHLRENLPDVEIVPYFMYWIPGLSFVDEAMAYYEKWFGCRIYRLPHPYFYQYLNSSFYQTPDAVAVIRSLRLPKYNFQDVDDIMAVYLGWDAPHTAIGLRALDNIDRRNLVQQRGAIGLKNRRFVYPCWDWSVNDVARKIVEAGIKLPKDYKYWGCTITAFDYQFIKPISENFPEDYARIREWFPLIDLELFRYEVVGRGNQVTEG